MIVRGHLTKILHKRLVHQPIWCKKFNLNEKWRRLCALFCNGDTQLQRDRKDRESKGTTCSEGPRISPELSLDTKLELHQVKSPASFTSD